MSERLRHLQRQQALLREHLAWIETEITRETAGRGVATPETSATTATNTPAIGNASPTAAAADELIARYAAGERQDPADIRRGCLIVFFLALLSVAGAVLAAWALLYR